MPKRQLFTLFIVIVSIFISFALLHPLAKYLPLSANEYSLETPKMNKHHKPPLFYLQNNGIYFIHPASEVNATGKFTFNSDILLHFHFSIQKGSPVGNILFVIKRNDSEIQKLLVNTKNEAYYKTAVHKGDTITVIADPLGATAGDWGNLELKQCEPHYIFKLRLIPLLWALFFIYLMGKGHFFIALNSYLGFYITLIAEKLNFGPIPFNDIMTYSLLFFALSFIFTFLYQELRFAKKFKIATILSWITTVTLYSIPLTFIIYPLLFGKPVSWEILFTIYQTNPNEALEFIQAFVSIKYLLFTIIATLAIGVLLWLQEKKEHAIIERSLLLFIILFLNSVVATGLFELRIPKEIHDSFSLYYGELLKQKEFEKKRRAGEIKFNAIKKELGETYVIIIGESLNKYHTSLYNYFRNTTPKLSEQENNRSLLLFNNAFANYPATMQALSYALTEANQYNHKNYYESLSLVDIFNKAGFETYWITNQPNLSDIDNAISSIAHEADTYIPLNTAVGALNSRHFTKFHDGEIVKILQKLHYIKHNNSKNKIIFIHLMGSHLFYKERYPHSFTKFKGEHKPYLFGKERTYYKDSINLPINDYDNSVYYNDYVVNSILTLLQKENGVTGLLYFADHGEDPTRGLGHFADPKMFTYEMIQIPLIAWFSKEYKQRYPQKYNTFISNKEKLFSNDLIYDTVLGLANIQTKHYTSIYDLSSQKYRLEPHNALTLHGKRHYNAKDNYLYWQEFNSKLLKEKNLQDKIIVKHANTVGKINDAWRLGYRSFQLDLFYNKTKKQIQAGSDKIDTLGGIVSIFKYFQLNKISKLLLDISHLKDLNEQEMLQRLDKINNQLPIKEKTLILSNNLSQLTLLHQNGWRVAYKIKNRKDLTNSNISNMDALLVNTKPSVELVNTLNSKTLTIIDNNNSIANSQFQKGIESYLNKNNFYYLIDFISEFHF